MSPLKKNIRSVFILLSAFLFEGADIALKLWALKSLPDADAAPLSLFSLALHKNYGIAFNLPLPRMLMIGGSALIIGILLLAAKKSWSLKPQTSLGLLIASLGALGNLFDRTVYGFTVDYLLIWHSAFNLSDLLILFGLGMILWERTRKVSI